MNPDGEKIYKMAPGRPRRIRRKFRGPPNEPQRHPRPPTKIPSKPWEGSERAPGWSYANIHSCPRHPDFFYSSSYSSSSFSVLILMPVPRVTLPFIRHGSERMRVSRLGLPRLIQTFGSTVPPKRPLLHCVLQHIIDHGDSPGHRFWMGWQRSAKR